MDITIFKAMLSSLVVLSCSSYLSDQRIVDRSQIHARHISAILFYFFRGRTGRTWTDGTDGTDVDGRGRTWTDGTDGTDGTDVDGRDGRGRTGRTWTDGTDGTDDSKRKVINDSPEILFSWTLAGRVRNAHNSLKFLCI